MGLRRIIKNFKIDGFDGLFYRLLKKLNFKIKYLNIKEKNKYNLGQRILKITNNQVKSGGDQLKTRGPLADWGKRKGY